MKKEIRMSDSSAEQSNDFLELSCDPIKDLILDMDVQITIASMPDAEREICNMLLAGQSPKKICNLKKISMEQFNKYLRFIRTRFIEYGFEQHEINF